VSQHPSLRSASRSKQHRNVLKRYERLEILEKAEKWKWGDSVFGIPKIKSLKLKVKKEKAAVETEAQVTEETAVKKEEETTPVAKEKEEAKK